MDSLGLCKILLNSVMSLSLSRTKEKIQAQHEDKQEEVIVEDYDQLLVDGLLDKFIGVEI